MYWPAFLKYFYLSGVNYSKLYYFFRGFQDTRARREKRLKKYLLILKQLERIKDRAYNSRTSKNNCLEFRSYKFYWYIYYLNQEYLSESNEVFNSCLEHVNLYWCILYDQYIPQRVPRNDEVICTIYVHIVNRLNLSIID